MMAACVSAAQARAAILGAMQAGAVGTFEDLAEHAGVPAPLARNELHQLAFFGRVAVVARCPNPHGAGRPRSVYALHDDPHAQAMQALQPVDVLAFARQCWR